MKKISLGWTIISIIGVLVFLFLLFELRIHDPYSWWNPNVESVESRNRWNERKMLYFYLLVGSFVSLVSSLGYWFFQKFKGRNLK